MIGVKMRETTDLEFKREISKSYLKTVSAFANYGTGRILFGVDDDGSTVGLPDPEGDCLRIEAAINDNLKPVPQFKLEMGENATVCLTVFEGPAKPYLYDGKAFRRADSSTVTVSRLEHNRLTLIGANTNFDALESKGQKLGFNLLEERLVQKTGISKLDTNGLISLELRSPASVYNNAAALLADTNAFPGTDIARFGDTISVILSRRTFAGVSLLAQLDGAMAMFDEYYEYEEVVGENRVGRELVPREAFREAVANALVHRAWDVLANVKISMFANRIEVISPGGLPDGVTEEEYRAGGPSVARNPIIANVFYRLGYIERFGTGIPRIVEAYATTDVSPRFVVRAESVMVVLPVVGASSLMAGESEVLRCIPKGVTVSRAQVQEASGFSKDKTIRLLNSLVDKGMIEQSGSARSTRYTRI